MSFQRDNRGGGNSNKKYAKRGFGGSFGGRDSGRPVMHQAICGECGKECEVPFKPSGDKPVFCRSCFKNRDETAPREFGRQKDFNARPLLDKGGMSKEQFEILNEKLDKILDVLESGA